MSTNLKRFIVIALIVVIIAFLFLAPQIKATAQITQVADKLPASNNNVVPASFSQARQKLGQKEGGYTQHPNDAGNWTGGAVGSGQLVGTNWGISASTYKTYFGSTPTVSDMKNLTYEQATTIYKSLYWDKLSLDNLPFDAQPLAELILDTSAQHGKAAMLVQRAINQVSSQKIAEDNNFGSLSKAALRVLSVQNPAGVYQALLDVRYNYYLVQPSFSTFGAGWINRIACFRAYGALAQGNGKCNIPTLLS